MKIIGISCFYHDAAAALIIDGKVIAAAQEERFTRIKHDPSFPINSIKFCLEFANLSIDDIDEFVFYESPNLKFNRLLETYFAYAPSGVTSFVEAMSTWFSGKNNQKQLINQIIDSNFRFKKSLKHRIKFSEHHLSHASSAFYPSPFEKSLILTMDGVGEWATTTVAIGDQNKINFIKQINFPHSIGLLYSAITQFLGFKVNSGEYKVMGLAPYGSPKYAQIIKDNLIYIKDDGSFRLNMDYFDYCVGDNMFNSNFENLFQRSAREPESPLTQFEMDVAASIQIVVEEIILQISRSLKRETDIDYLCLAGGVALNCVANGKIAASNIFKDIWIQPAAGDAGGSIGAALNRYYSVHDNVRVVVNNTDSMSGSLLGPSYDEKTTLNILSTLKANFHLHSYDEMLNIVASSLSDGKVVGWHQGRMEFGPRALGARSILADPRNINIQKQLNLKIKYRESFRPFAPSVLSHEAANWFNLNNESPYMLIVADIKDSHKLHLSDEQINLFGIEKLNIPKSDVPAVTHVDYSARIQTVTPETNSIYYDLISKFFDITNCPILVNTSFNVRGEPLVCSPSDSFNCFMGTDMDILAIGNFILYKDEQDISLRTDYLNKYELD